MYIFQFGLLVDGNELVYLLRTGEEKKKIEDVE